MENITWLLQESLFDERDSFEDFKKAIDRTGFQIKNLTNCFWDTTIDLKLADVNPETIIPFGTKPLVIFGLNQGWNVFWNTKIKYSDLLILGKNFINFDMEVAPLDRLQVPDRGKVYIKENEGFNLIKGQVISGYAWDSWRKGFKVDRKPPGTSYDWHPITGDTEFIWASPKLVINEWRVWVINNEVITSSQYVNDKELIYTNSDNNSKINGFAQEMVNSLKLGIKNYVLDIFEILEGPTTRLTVGEINCLHCSGWYAINASKIIKALCQY